MNVEQDIIIDARLGGCGLFAPKQDREDYPDWLEYQYESSQVKDGEATIYYGLSQRTNQIVYAGQNGTNVQAFGRYAGQVAYFLERMGGFSFEVKVTEVVHHG